MESIWLILALVAFIAAAICAAIPAAARWGLVLVAVGLAILTAAEVFAGL